MSRPDRSAGRTSRTTQPDSAGPNTVNKRLTVNRRTGVVENDAYVEFIRRVLRAYVRRVADGDIDSLTDMATLSAAINEPTDQAVGGLRGSGYSWTDIGAALGITRQAAQQRFGAAA